MSVPVNVYGRSGDPAAVAYRLATSMPHAAVSTSGGVVEVEVELVEGAGAVHVSAIALGADDPTRPGLVGFLTDGPFAGPDLALALEIASTAQTAVAIVAPDSEVVDAVALDDAMAALASDLAGVLDGFVLALGRDAIWGPDGTIWATANEAEPPGDPGGSPTDPAAPGSCGVAGEPVAGAGNETQRPEAAPEDLAGLVDAARAAGDLADGVSVVQLPDDVSLLPPPEPPSPSRVVARMLVLVAVAARCLTEQDGRHLVEARDGILAWADAMGIGGEMEPAEGDLLAAEPGAVVGQEQIDGSWGVEAAAVLAWSLGLIDLPPLGELTQPADLFSALGFADPEATVSVLAKARLRGRADLDGLDASAHAAAWRLREFGLRPGSMDLVEFAATALFPLSVSGLDLCDGDLAVDGRALADADPERIRLATSIATERHRAGRWLSDGGRWSEVDTST